jgi:prepilin-type processing-associated H-X9-DG protein
MAHTEAAMRDRADGPSLICELVFWERYVGRNIAYLDGHLEDSETPRSPIFDHRVQRAAVLVDVLDDVHDLARWDANMGERRGYHFKLIRFDFDVTRTFDLIQKPA